MAYDRDLETKFTGASAFARMTYARAVDAFQCYVGDPLGLLDQAIADSPGFAMAHILRAAIPMVGADAAGQALAIAAYQHAATLPMNAHEQGHMRALGQIMAGRIRGAARVYEDLAVEQPGDLVALHMGQLMDFLTGDARMMRDRIARALPFWSEDHPGYHAVLAMHAFGLEEMGQYARAEAAGRRALELEPRNNWAQHAVAHVLEMQDRRREGVAFMRGQEPFWAPGSFFAVHNYWHLALFHLGLGEYDEVLALHDGPIYGHRPAMELDMADAASLLWRLHLLGVDVGDRWAPIADAWQAATKESVYGFNDMHAAMAFVGAGREGALAELTAAQARAADGAGDHAAVFLPIARPIVAGIAAFAQGRYGEAADALRGVRNGAGRFGGSHAQRDVIDLTLIEAARRDGQDRLADALAAERALAHPR